LRVRPSEYLMSVILQPCAVFDSKNTIFWRGRGGQFVLRPYSAEIDEKYSNNNELSHGLPL
jgi:hypothetical protein